jgi:hypothetical protein
MQHVLGEKMSVKQHEHELNKRKVGSKTGNILKINKSIFIKYKIYEV